MAFMSGVGLLPAGMRSMQPPTHLVAPCNVRGLHPIISFVRTPHRTLRHGAEDRNRSAAGPPSAARQDSAAEETPEADFTGADLRRQQQQGKGRRRQADSTDWFASTITRRFGLAGGLAWLGVLTFGVVSEQVKTRLELASDARGTQAVENGEEVVLPSGVRYTDVVRGGGQRGAPGQLMVLNLKLVANGEVIQDSRKPLVFISGRRPLTGGLTPGAVEALSTMQAGGRRRISVPASQGFGKEGGLLRPTEHVSDKEGVIPPDTDLQYEIELIRVSVPSG